MTRSAYLASTRLLDFDHPALATLVRERRWAELPVADRIGAVYDFVRDEIRFGYNTSDDLPASRVLADGLGQCNTKTTLLMALLRAVGVACRFHGATIGKRLQKGIVNGLFYRLAPDEILHSWAEVLVDGRWIALEGVILDRAYLDGLRARFDGPRGAFLGFAVGTNDLANPSIEWRGDDTYIQRTGVHRDLGIFDDPDAFYSRHGANATGLRGVVFRLLVRRAMNRNVAKLRRRGAAQPTSRAINARSCA